MRIVFIQKSAGRGGAKNSLIESLTAIRQDGAIRPRVLAGEPGPFVDRCRALGIPCDLVRLPEWRKFFERLGFARSMKTIAEGIGERPDWIVSNEMWWAPHAARIARHLGCRSAAILRDGIATVPKARQYRLFDNDRILPVSSTIAEGLSSDASLAARTHVLFNSVRLPENGGSQAALLDERLGAFPAVKRWMLVIGRVCRRKKQADAVHILRLLADGGHDDLGLLLAGDLDADYEGELRHAIASTGLDRRVLCLGNFDDIRSLFTRAHAVLLTSTREGLPRSLVESLLAGLPAFSYPCEGVGDIYGEYLDAFTSRESTPEALHAVIRRAWAAPEDSSAAVGELHQRTLGRFSPAAHLQRLKSLLEPGPVSG